MKTLFYSLWLSLLILGCTESKLVYTNRPSLKPGERIALSALDLNFGYVPKGKKSYQELVLKNKVDFELAISEVVSSAHFYLDQELDSLKLMGKDSVRFKLWFSPQEEGLSLKDSIHFINTYGLPLSVSVAGHSQFSQAQSGLSAPELKFPITNQDSTQELDFYLTNHNRYNIQLQSLKLPAGFHLNLALPYTLKAEDSLGLSLRFQPKSEGNYADTLKLETDYGHSLALPILSATCIDSSFKYVNPSHSQRQTVYLGALSAGIPYWVNGKPQGELKPSQYDAEYRLTNKAELAIVLEPGDSLVVPQAKHLSSISNLQMKKTSAFARVLKSSINVLSLESCFANNANIREIPEDLFRYNTQVKSLKECFRGCEFIIAPPRNLLRSNPKLENIEGLFASCKLLRSVPVELFKHNPKLRIASGLFKHCVNLASVEHSIFSQSTLLEDLQACFKGCTAFDLGNYKFLYPLKNLRRLDSCFASCETIDVLPHDLLKENTQLESASHLFYDCNNILFVPVKLLSYSLVLKDISYAFAKNYSLIRVAEDVFHYSPQLENVSYCFWQCTDLTTFPTQIFAKGFKVTNAGELQNGVLEPVNLEHLLYQSPVSKLELEAPEVSFTSVARTFLKSAYFQNYSQQKPAKLIIENTNTTLSPDEKRSWDGSNWTIIN